MQTDNPALSASTLNITVLSPGLFIRTGGGTGAIDVSSVGGKNILDGGTNSNFLTGTPTSKAAAWADNQGTGSATGLTLHAAQAGTPQASFTLAGYTTAEKGKPEMQANGSDQEHHKRPDHPHGAFHGSDLLPDAIELGGLQLYILHEPIRLGR